MAESGHETEALEQYRSGLVLIQRTLARDPKNVNARKTEAALRLEMASQSLRRNNGVVFEELSKQLPVNRQLLFEYPEDSDCLLNLADNYSQPGMLESARSRVREGMEDFKKSVVCARVRWHRIPGTRGPSGS